MNRAFSFACFFLAASALHAEPPLDYALVWKDEFDGPQPTNRAKAGNPELRGAR